VVSVLVVAAKEVARLFMIDICGMWFKFDDANLWLFAGECIYSKTYIDTAHVLHVYVGLAQACPNESIHIPNVSLIHDSVHSETNQG